MKKNCYHHRKDTLVKQRRQRVQAAREKAGKDLEAGLAAIVAAREAAAAKDGASTLASTPAALPPPRMSAEPTDEGWICADCATKLAAHASLTLELGAALALWVDGESASRDDLEQRDCALEHFRAWRLALLSAGNRQPPPPAGARVIESQRRPGFDAHALPPDLAALEPIPVCRPPPSTPEAMDYDLWFARNCRRLPYR